MSATGIFLACVIVAAAIFAVSWKLGDVWIRKNIPLPEDYRDGAEGEAAMLAEFERIRKAHEAARRKETDR